MKSFSYIFQKGPILYFSHLYEVKHFQCLERTVWVHQADHSSLVSSGFSNITLNIYISLVCGT